MVELAVLHTSASPTTNIHPPAKNQPHTIEAGPPGIENDNVEAMEARRPIMENEIPKTSDMAKLRLSSCL